MSTIVKIIIAAWFSGITLSGLVQAEDISPISGNHNWYYQIGGGDLITSPANPNPTAITLGASGTWGANLSCGNFSLSASVADFMNDINSSADQALNQMVAAATGFVSSLPALIIQRSNPGLYDLFQNGLLRAEEAFNLSIASCEEMETDFVAGGNPFDKFVVLSKKNQWQTQKQSGGSAIAAKAFVEATGGDNGIPGIGGDLYAGKNQPPMNVTRQTAQAGYNTLIGRAPEITATAPVNSGRIAEIWDTPAKFEQYAADVLGSNEVRTCQDCLKASTEMGKGLLPQLYQERTRLATELSALVASSSKPTFAQLDKVSATGIRITPNVITALQNENATEKQLLMTRLSSDIATANVLEQAELLLQGMETGKREPNLSSIDMVTEFNEASINDLLGFINNILLSSEIRKTVSTDSVKLIMAREDLRTSYLSGSGRSVLQEKDMEGGAPQ